MWPFKTKSWVPDTSWVGFSRLYRVECIEAANMADWDEVSMYYRVKAYSDNKDGLSMDVTPEEACHIRLGDVIEGRFQWLKQQQ